jgi:hypothetical protein
VGGCGGENKPALNPVPDVSPLPWQFYMDAAEFNEFGRLSGAPEAPSGETAAESLGIDPAEVQAEIERLCQGTVALVNSPPPGWTPYPEDVPGYEQLFTGFVLACPETASKNLPFLRARVANEMSRNELLRWNLANLPQEEVDTFCGVLEGTKDITAPLLSNALEATELIPEGNGPVAEVGVGLLIVGCPQLVEFLT